MAKKQAEGEQMPEVIVAADDQVDPYPLWTMGRWGDIPQWRCALCPFDTLDGEEAILAHYLAEHAPPAPVVAPPIIQVYDRYGNPVERRN